MGWLDNVITGAKRAISQTTSSIKKATSAVSHAILGKTKSLALTKKLAKTLAPVKEATKNILNRSKGKTIVRALQDAGKKVRGVVKKGVADITKVARALPARAASKLVSNLPIRSQNSKDPRNTASQTGLSVYVHVDRAQTMIDQKRMPL